MQPAGKADAKDMALGAFVDAVACARPAPGGGAAAAVAQALGQALIAMASGISARRANEGDAQTLAAAAATQGPAAQASLDLADRDADAFAGYSQALALPKGTEHEKAVRRRAVEEAARAAVAFGREAAGEAVSALSDAARLAPRVRASVVEDIAAAVALLEAALSIHLANLEGNAGSLKAAEAQAAGDEADRLRRLGAELARRAREAIQEAVIRRAGA